MNWKLLGKIGVIAALMLVLMIPLAMIEGVIGERSAYRYQAKESIAASWTGPQKVQGPIVVVPYLEHHQRKVWNEKTRDYDLESYTEANSVFLLPDELQVTGEVTTEERSRGIYALPVYSAELEVRGIFSNQAALDVAKSARVPLEWQQPYLAVVITDIRGVVTQPRLDWRGAAIEFLSGSSIAAQSSGMHAPLGKLEIGEPVRYPFALTISLHGMETLELSPVGKSTEVRLHADWAHPSFVGRYLPSERTITETDFSAKWLVSSFSSDMQHVVESLMKGDPSSFSANTFGVSLVNPVDIYQQTERSVKYAVLFLLLTFTAFFLFEVMKGLRLHPMHYLLVGMALTAFYLLLVSLSEHVRFEVAYLTAAVACVGLIGVYISAVLKSATRALAFSGTMLLLYGMLFTILRSEDNALLMGSLLIFGVLAVVMLVTRRLDWYGVSQQLAQQATRGGRPQ